MPNQHYGVGNVNCSNVGKEFDIKDENKLQQVEDFIDITLASKETKEKPTARDINPTTLILEVMTLGLFLMLLI